MFCVLCRYFIKWTDPGWDVTAEEVTNELLWQGLNTDSLFEADANPVRLREIAELQQSNPTQAFAEFLRLAENGSVWSMIQVGYAYATGEGVRVDRVQAEKWYLAAHNKGSDYGLLQAGILAIRRHDTTQARALFSEGITRDLPRAKTYLAWVEREFGSRKEACILYEQAIASSDLLAEIGFARARAFGRFGFGAIPNGIRDLIKAKLKFVALVDERHRSLSSNP